MTRSGWWVALSVFVGVVGAAHGQVARTVSVARFDEAPGIDGRLNDTAWTQAKALELQNIKDAPLKNVTNARVGYDGEFLFVGIRCEESKMQDLRAAWSHAEERDNAIWQDDCVEVFLDPLSRGAGTGAHVVVNSAGVWYDAWDGDRSWDCGLRTATVLEASAWTVELAIPFRDLGFTPNGGERWRLNVGREEKPAGELSCLGVGPGNFGSQERYVSAVFAGGGPVRIRSVAVADADAMLLELIGAGDAATYRIELLNTQGSKILSREALTATVEAGATKRVTVPYAARPGEQTLKLDVAAADTEKAIYENEILLRRAGDEPKKRVWQLPDPLYSELLSDTPTGLVRDGAIYWFPEIDHGKFWLFACQYGQRYVKSEKYQMLADLRLRPLNNSFVLTTPAYNAFEHFRTHGVKSILYPNVRGVKLGEGIPVKYLLDPASTELYLEDVRTTLTQYGDVIWAVTFGDEVIDHTESAGIRLFAEHANAYPFIREVDQAIRTTFGEGKFGIPTSKSDKNAFRWIAYRRWLTASLNNLLVTLAQTVRETRPGTLVISDDPVALHHGLDYGAMKGHADIITHQLYPRRDPDFPQSGYLTKTIADLSGIAEVWPCPHVEEYAVSFRPDEVLEELSQVVRNGGTGLHLYLGDTVGKRKGKRCLMNDFYGAPDRWQVVTAVLNELRQTRTLSFPGPDCAILYGTDSIASRPERNVSDKLPCQYTFLGPVSRSAFVFVDEYMIERGKAKLKRFRAVYMPDAKYVRQTTVTALRRYVETGGILVATDPEAFSFYSNGESAGDARKTLFGITLGPAKRRKAIVTADGTLPLVSAAYRVEAEPGTETVAAFDDGSPAILKRAVGQGMCWYFASSPCTRKALSNPEWKAFFPRLQAELGVATGHEIWRFRFPAKLIKAPDLPTETCLTNNHIAWRKFVPITTCNTDTEGTYSYTPPPDNIRDQGGVADIPFGKGDLTDRQAAPTTGDVIKKNSKIQDWVVRYKTPAPFAITFDLTVPRDLQRIHVFYTGPLSGLTVATSTNGQDWRVVAEQGEAVTPPRDVAELAIEFTPAPARFVRLSFAERKGKGMFVISEIEIWGP
ncbi:MAG: hypothetical protein HN742_30670 [Lentisphaerae bacterium]|nr:hypothetical protein [Lentisphaerota bacterium]